MLTALPEESDLSDFNSLFHQNVETLAHYLYVCRGCKEGRAMDHWVEAEQQLGENLFSPLNP